MRVEGRLIQWDDAKGFGFIAPSAGGAKIFVQVEAFGLRPRRPFVGERVSYETGVDGRGKLRAVQVKSLEPKPAPAGPAPRGRSAFQGASGGAGASAGSAGSAGSGRRSGGRFRGSGSAGQRAQATASAAAASAAARAAPGAAAPAGGGRGGGEVWLVPTFALLVLLVHLAWPLPRGLWGTYMAMSLATFIVYALDKRAARLGQWRVKEMTLHGLALLCGWPGALLAQQLLRHKSVKPAFRRWFWLSVVLNIVGFVVLFTPVLTPFLPAGGLSGLGVSGV